MQKYECVMVLHPGISEADATAIVERFQSSVTEHGGEVQLHDHWGRRELAYPIEKQTNGDYHLLKFTADNSLVVAADRDLRLDDKVLRHLIVVDEQWAERNRASQAKRGKLSAEGAGEEEEEE
ncbi:MAG TPA: 30S ribosomal protein S6 [Candidatus Krumholzibacteria bacterium]|nr:30S ribosomal protein S6 [Candidatus Krumholzibacteria bacterium]